MNLFSNSFFKKYTSVKLFFAFGIIILSCLLIFKKWPGLKKVNYLGAICSPTEKLLTQIRNPDYNFKDNDLFEKIKKRLSENSRYFSFEFYDPFTSIRIFYNPEISFHAASTYKTLILLAIIKIVQEGKSDLNRYILIENRFQSKFDQSFYEITRQENDSLFSKIGQYVKISDLINEMIANSSNIATNILLGYYGEDLLNRTIMELGSSAVITRGTSDLEAYRNCINNTINSKELTGIYEIVMKKDVYKPVFRSIILNYLSSQNREHGVSYTLPGNTTVAHKYGQTSTVFHDAGVIIPKDQRHYYYSLLTYNYKNSENIKKTIESINQIVYKYIMEKRLESL